MMCLFGKVTVAKVFFFFFFMLNVSKLINENTSSSPYIVDSCDIWHGRLGHVNFSYIKKIVDLSLIPKLSLDNLRKCES